MNPHDPEGGSQRSSTANTRMSTSPTQYTGKRHAEVSPEGEETVDPSAWAPCAVDPHGEADAGGEDHRGQCQAERRREAVAQLGDDGPAGDVRGAEVALEHVADVVPELLRE
jgi:hypothetical protein